MNRHAFIAFTASMGVGVTFTNLPPILPLLRQTYGASNASIAMLVTGAILAHGLVQVPAGMVTDRLGVRWSLAVALALGFLSNAACGIHQEYGFLMAMRIMGGIGTGLLFVSGIKYATVHAPSHRRGLVQGIFGALINTGSILPFFVSPIMAEWNWSFVFYFTAFFFFVPLAAVVFRGEDPPPGAQTPRRKGRGLHRDKTVWALGLVHAVFFGGMMSISTWISDYLVSMNGHGFFLRSAGWVGAAVLGVSAAGRLLGGVISSRIRAQVLIWYAMWTLAAAYLLPGLLINFKIAVLGFTLAALMNSVTFSSVFFLAYRLVDPHRAGRAIGYVNFIASTGALIFPILFGYLIDLTGEHRYSLFFLTALALSALLPSQALKSRARKNSVYDNEERQE